MNWTNVNLVFLREVRDQLRDRRTLFMVAVLPLLLYPLLGMGMLEGTLVLSEEIATVVVLGADELPDPPLLAEDSISTEYFEIPQDAGKLFVVSDSSIAPGEESDIDVAVEAGRDELIRTGRQLSGQIDTIEELASRKEAAQEAGNEIEAELIDDQISTLKGRISETMSRTGIQVLVIVPENFRAHVEQTNRQIVERSTTLRPSGSPPRMRLVRNSADDKSQVAYKRVKEAVDNWEQQLLRERLESADLPESLPTPVNPDQIDLAQEEQQTARVWSMLFPFMLIVMAVTGAFYPAIDLGAGEKERGTMETLLISPATRTEIVFGKFFTILLFSISTALLNLSCMALTSKFMLSAPGGAALSKFGDASLPGLTSLACVFLLAIPLAALFSSLSLGLAMFARSSKEGQYYLTPLLMITMGLTVFCIWPTVEISLFYSVLPVIGPALLLKAILLGQTESVALYGFAVPVVISSVGYCALGLWWAVEQFQREEILFRGDDQFDLNLWIRHILRDKESLPSFTEGVFCFVLIMLLQFAAIHFMGPYAIGANSAGLMKLLMIQQLVIIATPALLMGVMLTTNLRRTLRLTIPSWKYLLVAAVLAPMLHPVTAELSVFLSQHFFPPLPESAAQAMAPMLDSSEPLWLVLLAFAVAPGICEELAFRGFILSGFGRGGRTTLAIVLSAVAFGVMHMFPQQVFNAALLGLIIGLIAVRSGSLLPGIVFHMLYNGSEVLRNRAHPDFWTTSPVNWVISVQSIEGQEAVRYSWPLVAGCGVVAAGLIHWLIRQGRPNESQTRPATEGPAWASPSA